MSKIVVAIYSHPELYPPTLNAINILSKKYDKLIVICRNDFKESKCEFPSNVEIKFTTKPYSIYELDNISFIRKILYFLRFTGSFLRNILTKRPSVVICYDYIPLFSFYLTRFFISKRIIIWYHNHDTPPKVKIRRFISISYWAALYHSRAFLKTNIFSIPSKERLEYFPLTKYKGTIYIIPNYPSRQFYKEKAKNKSITPNTIVKLLYQGSLGPHHGFEEIIPLLKENPLKWKLKLTLLGKIRSDYKNEILNLCVKNGITDLVEVLPMMPYTNLVKETGEYHIGLAIHKPFNITYATGATASNKIFEYIASCLPVIFYDSDHYKDYYKENRWAFFWDLKPESFFSIIKEIVENYQEITPIAFADFTKTYNFENEFGKIIDNL